MVMSQQITENAPGDDSTTENPFFSVIIPTYNSAATLDALLSSLENQTCTNHEVIVVDDKSTDDTAVVVKKHPAVQYVCMDSNQGPAAARNRGATLAKGEWLVFTDADTEFQAGTLKEIRALVGVADPDALVGSYTRTPANPGFMPRYKALWEYWSIDMAFTLDKHGLAPHTTWGPRPGVVRRTAFEKLLGFDTSFRGADLEDMDFGYRLHEAGYKIYFAPGVRIRHHYPATLWREIRPFARRCALWMQLHRSRPALDTAGEGSPRQVIGHLAGFAAFWATLLALTTTSFGVSLVSASLLAVYFCLNLGFLRLCTREESVIFAGRAFLTLWLHTVVMGLSAGWGLLRAFLGRC